MSLAINTGGRLELYARKLFFSDCSATTSGFKLLYSLNISGNKPFQRLQSRNLILILYYVIVKEKDRFLSSLTGIANYPSQWEIANLQYMKK